jgi:hypothetical protein
MSKGHFFLLVGFVFLGGCVLNSEEEKSSIGPGNPVHISKISIDGVEYDMSSYGNWRIVDDEVCGASPKGDLDVAFTNGSNGVANAFIFHLKFDGVHFPDMPVNIVEQTFDCPNRERPLKGNIEVVINGDDQTVYEPVITLITVVAERTSVNSMRVQGSLNDVRVRNSNGQEFVISGDFDFPGYFSDSTNDSRFSSWPPGE